MSGDEPVAILCYPTVGGSGRIACELAHGLARRGREVRVISYDEPAFLDRALVPYDRVEVLEYPLLRYPPYDQALAAKICEVHERYGIRVFHAHYAIPHAVAVLLADAMLGGGKLRLVTTLHGTDITLVGRDSAYRRAALWALERSNVVTAVSSSLVSDTRRFLGFSGRIERVPNFVDAKVFAPGDEPRWPQRDFAEPRRLVHLSTFRPVKRLRLLVRCMAELAKILPFELTLVGDGPELEPALELARELGVADRIESRGLEADVAALLRAADLYVFTSKTESFGLGVLEALACRVPVVGPAVGGVPEVLGMPEAGRLFDETKSASPDAFVRDLAMGMAELLLNAEPNEEAAARGPKRAREVFPFTRALEAYAALYEDVAR